MTRPGAVLLEVMLALALFVGAGAFCLAAVKSVFGALDRAERRSFAADLARSKLAELEAGMVAMQDLRGEWSGSVGSLARDDAFDEPAQWTIDVETDRTQYTGLTLITLTVSDASGPRPVTFTLRQLVALRATEGEAYEVDDLLEGLPQ